MELRESLRACNTAAPTLFPRERDWRLGRGGEKAEEVFT